MARSHPLEEETEDCGGSTEDGTPRARWAVFGPEAGDRVCCAAWTLLAGEGTPGECARSPLMASVFSVEQETRSLAGRQGEREEVLKVCGGRRV